MQLLYLCIIGLYLSLAGLMLFAFARNNKVMIFGDRKEVYRKKNDFFLI
jgi:hypothetical protein